SVAILQTGTQNAQALSEQVGFSDLTVAAVDTTDGLRITLSDNSIFHLRPSGNAPELRCYAEAQSYEHAQAIVNQVLAKVQQL
ncbi:TPA: phosphomannomutase, partial [Vibrio cholerae]|nr:phosphomannomutase [Vibrio cholerae]EJL6597508.1 phosphomannomutase [Vibrio cholerae]EJL6615610.1 phosphomannomutase [Vibrio cholerae]HDI3253912.1 phosphomannomutase [Vibrio cholerae]HDZ9215906.1 phosphomannomutase [Vibrio cholerae]